MISALAPACAAVGITLVGVAWDDPAGCVGFDAAVIGTTWDYWERQPEFLATVDALGAVMPLFNPAALVRWNSDKRYLRELAARGVPSVPTVWLDRADAVAVAGAFDTLAADDLVVKRQVGAGAYGQHRLARGGVVPPMTEPMMAQPFLPGILEVGEISAVFIDGALSHALVKRAAPGDYRIQSLYGGVEEAITLSPADLAVARSVLASLDEVPLYARVDLVPVDGALRLMELEVIEPYLYPAQGPELGERLASALARRLR